MEIKTVGVACDHAGYPLKKYVLMWLEEHGYEPSVVPVRA